MPKQAQGLDPQTIMEVRRRYYDALDSGMTKEDAAKHAESILEDVGGEPPSPKVKPKADEPPPSPPAGETFARKKLPADDLTKIHGLGPALVKKLKAEGVTSFQQIADWDEEQSLEMDRKLDLKGRVLRENWVKQAKDLI